MYTFQSRRDFSELGSILSLGLYGLVFFGAVQMFLPFSDSLEFIKSFAALLIFSGYIVYDTSNILYRYRPDQYVIASMSLYLDVLNLFMQILKVLSKNEEERNRKKSRKDRE
ncbi:Protein lifeguard 4 [Zancudomyces culisetae]|uniref:Protein lifeguard 4 n=1 Tax=Zancudomyces culisetae TaxID=1213189 RepID=A0A1R1PMP3_ZANCU|nr:Protein lifeguard 4 [Zancudomyces culisetae]|eukprot:OMH82241.1 Protein lifeguard 4 [Zancudomyces culisetae]